MVSHRTFRLSPAAILVCALLAGCAARGPDYQPQTPPSPAGWDSWRSGDAALREGVSIDQAPLSAQWWTQFGDATLDSLQARAREASPDLQTAALRFAQSRVQRATVAAQRGPQVDATAAAQRQRQSEYSASTRLADAVTPGNRDQLVSVLSEPFTLYQAGFDASWEIDLWGRVRRSIESADASVQTAAALLEQVRLSVASELARAYFDWRLAQRQLSLLDSDIATATQTLSLLQARAQGGLITALDVRRQRAQRADRQSRVAPLQARQAGIANQIGLLLGARPGELAASLQAAPVPATDALPATLPTLALGVPADVARRRPDIVAAEHRLHAATADIGVATADLYPRIVLGASFGAESFEAGRFGEWGTRAWRIGPSLSVPIFDQGRRRATIELRELVRQEAAVSYQQTVLKAWQEIDDALNGYGAERQRNARLREKVASSREALAWAQARYAGGLTDFLVPLDAERVERQARRELVDSNHQLFVQLISIYKGVGGGAVVQGASPSGNAN